MGMRGCSIAEGIILPLTVGTSCMLVEYLTLSFSNMITNQYSKWNLYRIPNAPQLELILFGAVLFLLGLILGFIFRLILKLFRLI